MKHIIRWNGVFEQGFLWICYFYMAYILQSSVYVIWVLNFKNHINKLHFVTAKSWKLLFSKIKQTWNYKEIMSSNMIKKSQGLERLNQSYKFTSIIELCVGRKVMQGQGVHTFYRTNRDIIFEFEWFSAGLLPDVASYLQKICLKLTGSSGVHWYKKNTRLQIFHWTVTARKWWIWKDINLTLM